MKFTTIALNAIRKKSPAIKSRLALELGCSESTINRYIRNNDQKIMGEAALKIIQKETGLAKKKILKKDIGEPSTVGNAKGENAVLGVFLLLR